MPTFLSVGPDSIVVDASIMGVDASGVRVTVNVCRCFDVDVATGEGERNDFFFGHVTD